jgi:hypothetical protein
MMQQVQYHLSLIRQFAKLSQLLGKSRIPGELLDELLRGCDGTPFEVGKNAFIVRRKDEKDGIDFDSVSGSGFPYSIVLYARPGVRRENESGSMRQLRRVRRMSGL